MTKEEAKKIFGENLRRIRISRGITQEELASKLGYTNRSSINKIEVGRSDMPRSKIEEAAKVLNVSPLELFKNEPLEENTVLEEIVDEQLKALEISYEKLNEANKVRLATYLQALLDIQEELNETHSPTA